MHKLKKILFISIITIIITVVVAILLISPITKYLIEKYDKKYSGRQITIDWAYVNPFTGYVYLSNVKIFEYQSDSIFISFDGLNANFAILKLFSKMLEVSDIFLDQPKIVIIQTKHNFNFDDLVTTFSSKESPDSTKKPFLFSFLDVKINDGHFYYLDRVIPVNFSIKNVAIESKEGWCWNNDIISANVSFLSEIGSGGMSGHYSMNLKNLDYTIDVIVNNFDLKVIEQYLKGFANYGTFSANLDANLKTNGSYSDAENITIKGQLAVNDFHFGKNQAEDYLSFDKVVFNLNEVNPKNHRYFIDSMSLFNPYFKYERYDYLDNLQTMFGKQGTNVSEAKSDPVQFNLIFTIGEYVKKLVRNFIHSDYRVHKLGIYNCDLHYNDYSLSEKFSMDLNPLYIEADSIFKNKKRVEFNFKSGIKPYGNVSLDLSINPNDSGDFDIQYHFQNLPLAMFNPYTISYTSFPLDRGTMELHGTWNVRDGIIQSDNHLVIIDPRISKRLRREDIKWIPVPLIMSFIRERGNVIDYEIPITGDLTNPKFHLKDVLFDLLGNIFIKPATTPYRMKIKNTETEIEKSLLVKWHMRQNSIWSDQEKFIERMADFLVKNPDASITVHPQLYSVKEKEHILFFEAKKKYFMVTNDKNAKSLSVEDSVGIDKMSVKDSLFVHYLNKQISDSTLFSIQEKCAKIIDSATINAKFNKINKEREHAFLFYFKKREVEKRIKISVPEDIIPYNGFSFYKIVYNGEFPDYVIKAYLKMNELNDDAPRKKFKKTRQKSKSILYDNTK